MNKTTTQIKFIIKLVAIVFKVSLDQRWTISRTFNLFEKLRRENGILYTYKYFKTCRLIITRYLCGKPLTRINDSRVSTVSGWPKKFLYLKDFFLTDDGKRYVLTLLTISKGINPSSKERMKILPSFDSITAPFKGREYFVPRFFIDVFKRKYRIKGELEELSSYSFFLNLSSSPTGVSILTSIIATCCYSGELLTSLLQMLKGAGEFYWHARMHISKYPNLEEKSSLMTPHGKLGIVHDAEGKERVIAMLDYWAQFALKPIHDDLLRILRKIPSDRTFTQNPFKEWKDDANKFWSLDLTAATDRFPLFLQIKLISAFYGKEISKNWARLLVGRGYLYQGKEYNYSIGQPMGAYSSWATFAVVHHLVVQWAAYKAGYKDFSDYILLGDDIVIKNDAVASKYIGIMQRLGVDISKHKTHVSKDTYEFAKRWIHKGVDISPLPMKGLLNHYKEPKTCFGVLYQWYKKTSFQLPSPIFEILEESYFRLFINSQWVTKELIHKRLYDFSIGYLYIHNDISETILYDYFINLGWKDKLPSSDEVLDFTQRITDFALSKVVSKSNLKIITLGNKLFNQFMPEVTDKNLIWWHPLIHSLRNNLLILHKCLVEYKSDSEGVKKLVDNLTIPGVTDLISLKRQVRKEIVGIDKVWKEVKSTDKIPLVFNADFAWGSDGRSTLSHFGEAAIYRGLQIFDTWCSGTIPKPKVRFIYIFDIYD